MLLQDGAVDALVCVDTLVVVINAVLAIVIADVVVHDSTG
jgi:hypothetical protein